MKKYELLEREGNGLCRIKAIVNFGNVKAGEIGGYVEREANLSHDGLCWVSGNARVSGDARVFGNAWVYGNAWVSGDAQVSGNARVSGNAWVSGNARVSGNAWVYGDAWKKSPLQIQGTRHFINESRKGYLKIGCHEHTFSEWKKNFKTIGKNNGYSDDEIKEYGYYIDLAIKLSKLKDQ